MNAHGTDPNTNPAVEFPEAVDALVRSTESVRGGFASRHLRVLLAGAACRAGDPSRPSSHDHDRCHESTGRRAAEALWEIFDEVQFNGPGPTERITDSLFALHRAFRDEADRRTTLPPN